MQFGHLVWIDMRPRCMKLLPVGRTLTLHVDELITDCRQNGIELNQRGGGDPLTLANTGLNLRENRVYDR